MNPEEQKQIEERAAKGRDIQRKIVGWQRHLDELAKVTEVTLSHVEGKPEPRTRILPMSPYEAGISDEDNVVAIAGFLKSRADAEIVSLEAQYEAL